MKAVVFAGEGQVAVDDVPAPTLADARDAIVRVTKTAICGSDLHVLHGKTPGMEVGGIIGHEFVGVVTEAGDGLTLVGGDQRVLGSFLIACGECWACAARRFNHCRNKRALGLGPLTGDLDGAQAEYVRIPNADLNLKVLDGDLERLGDEDALFAGDILATGFYAAHISEITPGGTVVVIGAGPVGMFCALAAKRAGAKDVLVLDVDSERARFARDNVGLDVVDTSQEDPFGAIAARTDGRMAEVAIEAVGSVQAVKVALRCVMDGGRVTIVGVYGSERYELPMGVAWVRGLDLRFASMANVHAHWDETLVAVAAGELDPTAIITHRLPLDDAVEGYRAFGEREAIKVVLTP
ncbi:MAG TPA: alcohol dehydrogenase catalytic domain-containing protein [Actinomycetota bacterium]